MAHAKTDSVRAMLRDAPLSLNKILRGAGRAGAKVVADEARERVTSDEVRGKIVERLRKRDDGRIVVRITVEDRWARAVGIWLEYGTAPHFIAVDDSQRQGMSVARINKQSLAIGGQAIGTTVHHPGARPHPFLRVSLDLKEQEAIAAAQAFINAHVGKGGFRAPVEAEEGA